jgi:hypothetical protein
MVYEIAVRGHLSPRVISAFEGFDATAGDGMTRLTGDVVDQAALHGVIDRVEDYGLVLLEVRAVE